MELNDKQLLIGLYLAYFGRPMRYYDEVIYFHLKGDQIISVSFSTFISNQSEFHYLYSDDKPIKHKINDLYNNLFSRDVDNDGLIYWSNFLNSNTERIKFLAYDLIYSTYQSTILNNNQAIDDYTTLLNKIQVCNCFIDIIRNDNQYNALYNPISYEPWITGYFIDEIKSFIRKVDSKYQPSINIIDDFIQKSFYQIHNQFLSPAIIMNNISLNIPILGSESRNIKASSTAA